MRVRIRLLSATLLTVVMLTHLAGSAVRVGAQPTLPGNALVQVFSNQPGGSFIAAFSPNVQGIFRQPVDDAGLSVISPDGQFVASTDRSNFINYGANGGQTNQIKLYQSYYLNEMRYSRDSRWLLYSMTSLELGRYMIGMLEIITGKRLEFIGKSDDFSVVGPRKAALPLDFDGSRLLLAGFVPFSDAGFGGLFAMPLPDLAAYGTGQYGMPNAQPLIGENASVLTYVVSPDSRWVAYLYNDPNNPAQSFQPLGPSMSVNSLAVTSLITGETRILAKAGPGQALGTLGWFPDSSRILFTGGNYQNSYYLLYAKMYSVTVPDAVVIELGPSVSEPTQYTSAMMPCGTTLYSVVTRDTLAGALPENLLLSSPLDGPTTYRVLAVSPSGFQLIGCTPLS
jgi:hypothetical protein